MAKPHNPGCATNDCCKCVPITERIDEFDSTIWKCFLGLPNGYGTTGDGGSTAIGSKSSGWTVTGGQLVYSRPSGVGNEDPITADAVRLAVPYSTEIILEVAELNVVSGDQAELMIHQCDGGNGTGQIISTVLRAGILGTVPATVLRIVNSTSSSQTYTNPVTAVPFTLWYKVQVDTDGITHWLWIDGTKPAISGVAWGTKLSVTPPSLTGSRKRYWGVGVRGSLDPRANWAKFNRMEIREWDHTSVTMPDPDNP